MHCYVAHHRPLRFAGSSEQVICMCQALFSDGVATPPWVLRLLATGAQMFLCARRVFVHAAMARLTSPVKVWVWGHVPSQREPCMGPEPMQAALAGHAHASPLEASFCIRRRAAGGR
mmetsp:Transcript_9408/g.27043  ORF Transcript_9408/g.27043 Transcript_9408/m.27043 type:complete len:117 (+) Transcript_9408:1696-2046(+)